MTIRTLTKFRNQDATIDLNHRLRDLVTKGVFFGGQVTPVSGSLEVDVQPLAAIERNIAGPVRRSSQYRHQ